MRSLQTNKKLSSFTGYLINRGTRCRNNSYYSFNMFRYRDAWRLHRK